jgi:hypothetical protein
VTYGLCIVATFSIASGFTLWPIATLPLLCTNAPKQRLSRQQWFVWGVTAVLSTAVYFHGAQSAIGGGKGLLALFSKPVSLFEFFAAYVSAPFCYGAFGLGKAPVAISVCVVLLSLLGGAVTYTWQQRRDPQLLAAAAPWIALALITVANGLLTTIGRADSGPAAAVMSRYIGFQVLLPIALLFLLPLLLKHRAERRQREYQPAPWFCLAAVFAVLFASSTLAWLPVLERFQQRLLVAKALVLLSAVCDEPVELTRYVHRTGEALRPRIDGLDRAGYIHPPIIRSSHISEIAAHGADETNGAVGGFGRDGAGRVTMSGWATLPDKLRPADAVILTYEVSEGDPLMFAVTAANTNAPAAVTQTGDERYHSSGWEKSWAATAVPANARRVRAWAFDAEERRAYLIGSGTL